MVKNPPASSGDVRDVGLILGLGRFPGVGNGNPLQYSCLENPTDRGAWWAILHEVAKSWTRLSDGGGDARKDQRRDEKGMKEDEMVGWHH